MVATASLLGLGNGVLDHPNIPAAALLLPAALPHRTMGQMWKDTFCFPRDVTITVSLTALACCFQRTSYICSLKWILFLGRV